MNRIWWPFCLEILSRRIICTWGMRGIVALLLGHGGRPRKGVLGGPAARSRARQRELPLTAWTRPNKRLLWIERQRGVRRPTNRATLRSDDKGAFWMILQSLAGLPAFLVYFCTGLVAVVAFLFVYTRVTHHDEFQLIRDNVPSAAIALGLSLLGFVLPVVSAIAHSANVWDCLIWSADRADRSDLGLFHRQDTGAEPVGADRRRRTRARDLARAGLARRRRAQRRFDDLLRWPTNQPVNSGRASRWRSGRRSRSSAARWRCC